MLRVLVAEDSATARLLITSLLSSDSEIQVVGQARNGAEAIELCERLRPDVITMDIQMPVVDGLEATRQIVAKWNTPVIIVSSLDAAEVSRSMQAYNAGALAVLAKPAGPGTPRFERDCRELLTTVKALADVGTPVAAAPSTPESAVSDTPLEIVGLVASTGGPMALRALFVALSPRFEPPILIVQHIAMGFGDAFASWLGTATGRTITRAADGAPIAKGASYVVPEDRAATITAAGTIELRELGEALPGSAMLASLAVSHGARAAGAVLSGIGTDGVDGLRALRDRGGSVFVQDEQSCIAFDAPRAALAAGVAASGTAVAEIARRLGQLSTRR